MKIEWLEKLAADGSIRQEALDKIYESCSNLLETDDDFDKAASALGRQIKGTLIGLGVLGAGTAAYSAIHDSIQDMRVDYKTQNVRNSIVNNPSFSSKEKEKAEARFNEILKFAPSLGPNTHVMARLVHSKMESGLTDQDVQNLISIQTKMTPNPLDYSRMSEKTSEERCGELLADQCIGLYKEAAAGNSLVTTVGGHLLRTVLPLAAIGAGISGITMLKGKWDERKIQERLNNTYQDIMLGSKGTVLEEHPDKAKEAFRTLSHFAPHVAVEPNAAKAFMLKLVSYGTGPAASDIKDLSEIQKNFRAGLKDPLEGIGSSMTAVGLPGFIGRTWEQTMSPYQKGVTEDIERRLR